MTNGKGSVRVVGRFRKIDGTLTDHSEGVWLPDSETDELTACVEAWNAEGADMRLERTDSAVGWVLAGHPVTYDLA